MKRFVSIILAVTIMATGVLGNNNISRAEAKPYIAFGANLTSPEKAKVMKLLDINNENISEFEVIKVTNEEEHEYLDDYLDRKVIGTRALSSVKIEVGDSEAGINVETHNISYCTKEMYANALATAGVSDADVVVAAPFKISGTAALVGAMKAYGEMTGEDISEIAADAANNELVLTGKLSEDLGAERAAELVALIKDKVVSGDLDSEEDIKEAIDDAAKELGIDINDSHKQLLLSLMEKIKKLDIDVESLKKQASGIYDKLKNLGVDISDADGFFEKIANWFSGLFEKIQGFFK